MKPGITPEK
jgi:hypothetical protein